MLLWPMLQITLICLSSQYDYRCCPKRNGQRRTVGHGNQGLVVRASPAKRTKIPMVPIGLYPGRGNPSDNRNTAYGDWGKRNVLVWFAHWDVGATTLKDLLVWGVYFVCFNETSRVSTKVGEAQTFITAIFTSHFCGG